MILPTEYTHSHMRFMGDTERDLGYFKWIKHSTIFNGYWLNQSLEKKFPLFQGINWAIARTFEF